jgi:hypothetical protein
MLVRIKAPHFVAGYDTETGNIAPIISYMKGWDVTRVRQYCKRKGWQVEEIERKPVIEACQTCDLTSPVDRCVDCPLNG